MTDQGDWPRQPQPSPKLSFPCTQPAAGSSPLIGHTSTPLTTDTSQDPCDKTINITTRSDSCDLNRSSIIQQSLDYVPEENGDSQMNNRKDGISRPFNKVIEENCDGEVEHLNDVISQSTDMLMAELGDSQRVDLCTAEEKSGSDEIKANENRHRK